MAVVAATSPGRMQPCHHLVPHSILAQGLWEACHVTCGQPLDFLHHLLSFVHRVEAVDPKHDLNLDLEGQHAAKRFVFWIHQPATVHFDTTTSRRLTIVLNIPL